MIIFNSPNSPVPTIILILIVIFLAVMLQVEFLSGKWEKSLKTTTSNISVKSGNVYKTVYCHYDGYPEGVGEILLNHYNSQEAAEALIKGGDIMLLGKKCDRPKGHSYKNPIPDYTVYYGRDRGDEDTGYTLSEQKPKLREYYLYIFEDGKWFVSSIYEYPKNQELTHELINICALAKKSL